MKNVFWLGILTLVSFSLCSASEPDRNPYLGNIPMLKLQYMKDLQQFENECGKKISAAPDEKALRAVYEEAEREEEQLKQRYLMKFAEESYRLLGAVIPCVEAGEVAFHDNSYAHYSFTVKNGTAVFDMTDDESNYFYFCQLIAREDMEVDQYALFEAVFVDDHYVEYGSSLQMLPFQNRQIRKGEVIPCQFIIFNIETDDPVALQKNCTRVVLKF